MIQNAYAILDSNVSYFSDQELVESELEELEFERDENHALALIVVEAIIMGLILVGNSTVILLTATTKELRTPTHLYIMSLCVADITVAVLPVPLHVITTFSSWQVTSGVCRSLEYFNFFATTSNAYCVVVIAMDRHRAVVHPFHARVSSAGCLRRITSVWLIGALYAIRAPTTYDVTVIRHMEQGQYRYYHVCVTTTDQSTRRGLIILDSIVMCLLPFAIIVGSYVHILFKLFRKQRKVALALGMHIHSQLIRRNKHVLKMVIAVMSLSMFCEVPVYIWEMYVFVGEGSFPGSLLMYDILKLLSYSNSWLNVLVYVWFNESLRNALKARKCCVRRVDLIPVLHAPPPHRGQGRTTSTFHSQMRIYSI
ncbi:pyroglutamylated RF-amide peptide receptor-like [Liolophura sinensis]|uniref:pyroglutamylated RF-amide peptide receptor-like n=1 Tax=Liolophura sinensis TaxID=3198878 RepID=UPI003158C575